MGKRPFPFVAASLEIKHREGGNGRFPNPCQAANLLTAVYTPFDYNPDRQCDPLPKRQSAQPGGKGARFTNVFCFVYSVEFVALAATFESSHKKNRSCFGCPVGTAVGIIVSACGPVLSGYG
ncbi:MAG: hypothetical protein KC419_17405 [Anaerolineales bacterium]|nr:hypothetical protein [Anaerolineales bacterium]